MAHPLKTQRDSEEISCLRMNGMSVNDRQLILLQEMASSCFENEKHYLQYMQVGDVPR